MAKKKRWIQEAIKKPGAFTEWCKRQGFSGATKECIEMGKRSSNPTTRRRAVLAETLKKLAKKRKKK
ncbi:thymidylate kinase [uncultured virus]|uniref:Thymidylate kinase n=1 Tax=uncultured virus TaxID=340016 RepID=A0A5Q0TWS8_9VIRU|nr:thymidylate kinase [uncultured virus]